MAKKKKSLALQDHYALAAAAMGRSLRPFLPDAFAEDDKAVSVRSRMRLEYPNGMDITLGFQRGIADLNGITWATLPREVTAALDTLNPQQLACFVGMLAARARTVLSFEEKLPAGALDNIHEAESMLWEYYGRYPIQKLNVGFNPQMYALGLKMFGTAQNVDALAQDAQESPYIYNTLRIDSLMRDSDIIPLVLGDVRAFAHMVSRHFKLEHEQEEAFSILLPAELAEALIKTPEGKYRMDADKTLKAVSKKSEYDAPAIDEKAILRREGVDCAAQDTSLDKISSAPELVDLKQAKEIREALEHANPVLMNSAARIAQQLARTLAGSRQEHIIRALEDGHLDTTQLSRLVASPDCSSMFYETTQTPELQTEVTLLIDNSGSMSGHKIQLAYITALYMTRALERVGIPVEILGFTTGDGEIEKDVGRVSPLRLIVYKDSTTRHLDEDHLAAMLCRHIMGLTPTGDGLMWAANRMLARRNGRRKILIPIEDAQPFVSMGDKTKSSPEQHLRAVIRAIEARGDIELAAIGIEHNPKAFYKKSIYVENSEQLPRAVSGLLTLLARASAKGANTRDFVRLNRQIQRTANGNETQKTGHYPV